MTIYCESCGGMMAAQHSPYDAPAIHCINIHCVEFNVSKPMAAPAPAPVPVSGEGSPE